MSAAELGQLDRDAFVATLGGVAEGSPWVAEQAWLRRPFADLAALQHAFRRSIEDAAPERQLALIRAHPDLAGRAALAGDLTSESQREQQSAGLDRLSPDELATFTRLNQEYRDRFGFPFVVCVAEHTTASILAAYAMRLPHDPDTERRLAVGEVAKIVDRRLAALA